MKDPEGTFADVAATLSQGRNAPGAPTSAGLRQAVTRNLPPTSASPARSTIQFSTIKVEDVVSAVAYLSLVSGCQQITITKQASFAAFSVQAAILESSVGTVTKFFEEQQITLRTTRL